MSNGAKWFGRIVWFGILLNLCFAVPAIFAPDTFLASLDQPPASSLLWLQNVGVLLVALSIFYSPTAIAPGRYPTHTKLVVLSRWISAVFWFVQLRQGAPAEVVRPLMLTDGVLGIILLLLLNPALAPENRIGLHSIGSSITAFFAWLKGVFATTWVKVALVIVVIVSAVSGYVLWRLLLKPYPDFEGATPEEHFKHAPIGLSTESRLPYDIWEVLPKMFPEKLPRPGGWETFGFIFEPGQPVPIGFSRRQIGYPAIEANCSLCHTGTYRTSPTDTPKVILGAPAHTLNLEAFQKFLYDCASDPRFTPANVMKAINDIYHLPWYKTLVYQYMIIPVTKHGLLQQQIANSWEASRPTQGPGRVDTFNPTKFNVFHMPDDGTIGTVDLPQIWNQRPRESLYLHWDGNNNKLEERNYAAAMAVGATPKSVIPASFKEVTDFLLDLHPPAFPFPVDQAKAVRGKTIYDGECASCHAFGSPQTGQVTAIDVVGTDRHRLDSFTEALVDKFHTFETPPFKFDAYRKTNGYANTPLDGIWARAPYLHNGSVPTLWDLLQPAEKRPTVFFSGYDVYDPKNVGFVTSGPDAESVGFKFQVCMPGNSNMGHAFGTDLKDSDKWDLIEYMKTL